MMTTAILHVTPQEVDTDSVLMGASSPTGTAVSPVHVDVPDVPAAVESTGVPTPHVAPGTLYREGV